MEEDKPEEPGPGDCCGSGCANCVWDVYFDKLATWEAKRSEKRCRLDDSAAAAPSLGIASKTEDGAPSTQSGSTHPVFSAATTPAPVIASVNPPSATSSFAGSIVLKYIDGDTEEDDDGQLLVMDAKDPLWRKGFIEISDVKLLDCSSSYRNEKGDGNTHQRQHRELMVLQLTFKQPLPTLSEFVPGDTVEVLVPNDLMEVEALCGMLGVSPNRLCRLSVSPFVESSRFPRWLPSRRAVTVSSLMQYYVDTLSSSYLRRPFFSLLHKTALAKKQPVSDIEVLAKCAEDHVFLDAQCEALLPSLKDILSAFPHATPSLAKFLEVSAPLRPRSFSVVDVAANGLSVTLCARHTVVDRQLPSPHQPQLVYAERFFNRPCFFGHVSNALQVAAQTSSSSLLRTSTSGSAPSIWCRPHFGKQLLRGSAAYSAKQLFLIGGGSGVAPLLATLLSLRAKTTSEQHRQLVFGCRESAEALMLLKSPVLQNSRSSCKRIDACVSSSEVKSDEEAKTMTSQTERIWTGCRVSEWLSMNHNASAEIRQALQSNFGPTAASSARHCGIIACGPSGFLASVRISLIRILDMTAHEAGGEGGDGHQRLHSLEAEGYVVFEDWSAAPRPIEH